MRPSLPLLDQSLQVVTGSSILAASQDPCPQTFSARSEPGRNLIGVIHFITSLSCHECTLEADLPKFSRKSSNSYGTAQQPQNFEKQMIRIASSNLHPHRFSHKLTRSITLPIPLYHQLTASLLLAKCRLGPAFQRGVPSEPVKMHCSAFLSLNGSSRLSHY
jgi:hypothetical protein